MAVEDKHLSGIRHSLAHLMAAAVLELYPGAKNTIGPAIEDGFYTDFEMPQPISEDDLPKIEKKMREILKTWRSFEGREATVEEGRKVFAWNPYKVEMLEELAKKGEKITIYTSGKFVDLCRGGHVEDAKEINPQSFKLNKVSGAYWRADQSKQQLQRIYGVAFETPDQLKEYLAMLDEAKKRDHRKLGQELDLFVFSPLVGPGLPLWTPRGTILRNELDKFVQELRDEAGFQQVTIPHITKKDLYEKSGHWSKFKDELFKIKTREGHEYAMKPMNCPHHTQIYDSRPRSYRDLPIRYRDTTMVYRDEQSGELGGLSRVLCITQDDAHVFCRLSQAKAEALSLWDIIERFYSAVGIPLRLRLSLHDPSNKGAYIGTEKQWKEVEGALRDIVRERAGDDFEEAPGDAAFYGPKLDFLGRDALGREHQVATVQIDFGQPEGFDLTCTNEEGSDERIVMVHCAVMGSLERFLSVYIEHTGGKFPVWLAPEQLRIITLNQDQNIIDFAHTVANEAKKLGVRAVVDAESESVGKKIRRAELMKVPYSVVIGPKEVESGEITPRIRKDMEVDVKHPPRTPYELVKTISNESKTRINKTSL